MAPLQRRVNGPILIGAPPQPSGLPHTWSPPCPAGTNHLRVLERRYGGDGDSDDDDNNESTRRGEFLLEAAACNDSSACSVLLAAGSDPRWENRAFESALSNAHEVGSKACAELILNALSSDERLLCAAKSGDAHQVEAAFAAGATIAAADDMLRSQRHHQERSSVLHWASAGGHDACIGVLIAHGADVNAVDPRLGWTPLMTAVCSHRPETVRTLLAARAAPWSEDISGRHALSYAQKRSGCRLCAEALCEGMACSRRAEDQVTLRDTSRRPRAPRLRFIRYLRASSRQWSINGAWPKISVFRKN